MKRHVQMVCNMWTFWKQNIYIHFSLNNKIYAGRVGNTDLKCRYTIRHSPKLAVRSFPRTCRYLGTYINRHFLIMGSNFRIAFFGSTCNFKIQAIGGGRDIGNFRLQFSIWHTNFAQVLFLYLEFSFFNDNALHCCWMQFSKNIRYQASRVMQ